LASSSAWAYNHDDERYDRAKDSDHENVLELSLCVEPQTDNRVTTAPLCGKLSSVPEPMTATRWSIAG
jgi:hypothetical protein